jgi:2-methylfumaryl-CoA isomerase
LDERRVIIVTLTPRHFADLGRLTGLTEVFAELERLLGADFGLDADRYRHRETIAALVEPWFAARPYDEVAKGLDGTFVLWSRYRSFTELVADAADNPLLVELDQPGIGRLPVPGSPLNSGEDRGASLASSPGSDTAAVLADLLDLDPAQLAALRDRELI